MAKTEFERTKEYLRKCMWVEQPRKISNPELASAISEFNRLLFAAYNEAMNEALRLERNFASVKEMWEHDEKVFWERHDREEAEKAEAKAKLASERKQKTKKIQKTQEKKAA